MLQYQFDKTIELSHRAQELFSEDEARWRSFVALNLAGVYRFTNKWAAACQTYMEASDLSLAAGDRVNALTALSMRGEVLQAQGHLHQSAQQFEHVLQLARRLAIPTAPVTGFALVGLGRAWCEWNNLEVSANYVQDGLEYGKKADILDILLRGYLVLARVRQAQGDLEGALDALEKAESAARQIGTAEIKDWVNALRAQARLAHGETEAAIGWASSYKGEIQDRIYPSIAIALAKVRLVQERPDEALKLLEHALHSAHAIGRLGNAVQILVVKALVHRAQGSLKDANSALLEALTLAEPEGYIRTFLDEGEPLRLLISDFRFQIENRMRGIVPDNQKTLLGYIHKLLVGFIVSSILYTRKSMINDLASSIPEPLSERELEVLRLMVAGLSNRDIADMGVVSINTVKTQVKSIFGKLGVHHREDAIAAARELRLL
jgi:LuxR family maltose regulon positive regulatory protein